jgi:hypothetical protein
MEMKSFRLYVYFASLLYTIPFTCRNWPFSVVLVVYRLCRPIQLLKKLNSDNTEVRHFIISVAILIHLTSMTI